jgi:hypothetical protein
MRLPMMGEHVDDDGLISEQLDLFQTLLEYLEKQLQPQCR